MDGRLRVDTDNFVSAKKNLRIQKSPDTCGQGLKGIATGHQIEYLVPRKEEGALISLKAHH